MSADRSLASARVMFSEIVMTESNHLEPRRVRRAMAGGATGLRCRSVGSLEPAEGSAIRQFSDRRRGRPRGWDLAATSLKGRSMGTGVVTDAALTTRAAPLRSSTRR